MIRRIAVLILVLLTPVPARAQAQAGVSDVVILIQPFDGSNMLAVTFPKQTPHSEARRLLQDLAGRGGWKLGAVEIKDDAVPDFRDPSKTIMQTGASATMSGAPLMHQGGYRLQPFVEVFADYPQVELLFIENAEPSFAGIQKFQSAPVSIELLKAGSPYRYRIQIDKSAGPIPKLPLTQAAVPPPPPAPVQKGSAESKTGSMAFVLLISAGSGLAVFFGLLVLSRLRGRRDSASGARGRPTARHSPGDLPARKG